MPVEHTPTHQMPTRSTLSPSLATDQRSLLDPRTRYPLWPPLLGGDPTHSDERVQYPVEVGYDLASLRDPTNRAGLLGDPVVSGLRRWAALLPPLVAAADLGAGDTPLLEVPRLAAFTGHDGPIYVKDETQNPTWSHKDRLNFVTLSTALACDAPAWSPPSVATTGRRPPLMRPGSAWAASSSPARPRR